MNHPEFNSLQTEQIQLGAEKGVDISIYAKPELVFMEMQKIYYTLKQEKLEKAVPACNERKAIWE